jgi:ABC-type antimicrobial peptide transport system permease subunit
VISASVDPLSIASQVKAQVTAVHPRISIDVRTLEQQVKSSMTVMRTIATLAGFFGVLALVLATIGLYGIMAYNVARRRNEIGVRIALGAAQGRVVRMVLGEVGRIVVIGVGVGVAVSLFATKLIAAFLYGTTPTNPTTLGEAGVLLLAVGLLAAALPAIRAARLDPVAALREE